VEVLCDTSARGGLNRLFDAYETGRSDTALVQAAKKCFNANIYSKIEKLPTILGAQKEFAICEPRRSQTSLQKGEGE